jgi:hypothetical protein
MEASLHADSLWEFLKQLSHLVSIEKSSDRSPAHQTPQGPLFSLGSTTNVANFTFDSHILFASHYWVVRSVA